jgi:hypothetical protein
MTEREFWITVRQALLLFVSAIERRYLLGKHAEVVQHAQIENNNTI